MYMYVIHLNRSVSMLRTPDLVDLTTKGIPNKYRTDIWMIYSGALDLQVQVHVNIYVHVPDMGRSTLEST